MARASSVSALFWNVWDRMVYAAKRNGKVLKYYFESLFFLALKQIGSY